MRTFARKPKTAQAMPAKATVPGLARLGQSREVSSILHLQRTVGNQAVQRTALKDDEKKAELEFHSRFSFNTKSGSSSTGPSEAGFTFFEVQWTVLNSGWQAAPEHVDKFTLYKADRCSGCREEKDEFFSTEVTAPATAPGAKYEAVTAMFGMTLPAGHYDAYVDLDIYDEVDEINKDNNRIFTTWFAAPPKNPEPPE
ncbi:MAG TPA: hypothetical protein VF414_11485 [Thermoanaerobaculia bacterium]